MTFLTEREFESALIKKLANHGWEAEVLENYDEQMLIRNWANILFENNRSRDRLNNCPLTDSEMARILEQVNRLRTPFRLNGYINGKTISVKRDNPDDPEHLGKEVALKIYDRDEIAAGQSRYQIVRQPRFVGGSRMLGNSRGDLMLLINGMPLFHIELKKSGVPLSNAWHQIEHYSKKGVFTGLFSLVQIFVAMTPDETVYFANPGPEGKFNPEYYFHWADFNNEPINAWHEIAAQLLSIPMAHQLIGFYTVADSSDSMLKVMRSYQYYAASAISLKVANTKWEDRDQLGGYIWHTTGSGKTLTSFKSAQLIANSADADKVVFLVDRIELGTQSLLAYQDFADDRETVGGTEDTYELWGKLKSNAVADILIVTSIQKMSRIKDEGGYNQADIDQINRKRLVFIIDECHRSTFGEMLLTIKRNFPNAIFFGFTGTPIHDENQKHFSTTAMVFGDELHRYSLADGIRDKNVLGFDPYRVLTYRESDLRREIGLDKVNAPDLDTVYEDPLIEERYHEYQDMPMAGFYNSSGVYVRGIEDYIPRAQYRRQEHQIKVVEDIRDRWRELSRGSKFHAIFATSSIPEAIEYYALIRQMIPDLRVTCLFDPTIDNVEGFEFKQEGLVDILEDYNDFYGMDFTLPQYASFKKDVSFRLAHRHQYRGIERTPEKQLDLLIVVNQMLTGFDSKWVNTLYLDKLMEYEYIIQAFSRTNRIFGPDKPHGTIRYYRYPFTMTRNIEKAVKLYSGDKVRGLFVDRLGKNLRAMIVCYEEIKDVFAAAGVADFARLPGEPEECGKFALLFNKFNRYLAAAKLQGFNWGKSVYEIVDEDTEAQEEIEFPLDERTYLILAKRYQELFHGEGGGHGDLPYDIEGYITEINTERIDADYMQSRFVKFLKELNRDDDETGERVRAAEQELHKTFATLSQEEQRFAEIILLEIKQGDLVPSADKTMREYVSEYMLRAYEDNISQCAEIFGLDAALLREIVDDHPDETEINAFGRFWKLITTVDKAKARSYFTAVEQQPVSQREANQKLDALLRDFILRGGYPLELPLTSP